MAELSEANFYLVHQSVESESALVLRTTQKPYGLNLMMDYIPFDGRPVIFENMFHDEDKAESVKHTYTNAHEASGALMFHRDVYKELRSLDYLGSQFIPAAIRAQDGGYVERYHAVNVFNKLDLIDYERSEFHDDAYDDKGQLSLTDIHASTEKVVFSQEKLSKVDSKYLTIFSIEYFGRRMFVSEQVKNIIESHPPIDVDFIRMDLWRYGDDM